METEAASIVDGIEYGPIDEDPPGTTVGVFSVGRAVCPCMDQIEWADIERGYHSCGRLLAIVCGPANFGADDD